MNIVDAVSALGVEQWVIRGEPTNEQEFNDMFFKIVGEDVNGMAIESSDPADFGVTWDEVKTKYDELIAQQPAKDARSTRDRLIAETDWMALSDVQMSDGWAAYRQALRDVPEQPGFPDNIDWPEKPE